MAFVNRVDRGSHSDIGPLVHVTCATAAGRSRFAKSTAAGVLHQLLNYDRAMTISAVLDARLDTLGRIGTAMADGVRRRILIRLLEGPAYPAELADEMSESRANVSNHLSCLRGCGLVRATREGRQVRYDLADRKLARALRLLSEIDLVLEPGHEELGART